MQLQLSDAKELIGKICSIRYSDRGGNEHETTSKIYDATYVPLYGGYLVTATEDIRFDRIRHISLVEQNSATAFEAVATTTSQVQSLAA